MRLTKEEFHALCARNHLNISVQTCRKTENDIQENERTKTPKYRNRKVYVYECGVAVNKKDERLGLLAMTFDSEKEYSRYQQLKLLEKQGKIFFLNRQVPFVIQEPCVRNDEKLNQITYKADFTYEMNGIRYVEDVKGYDEVSSKYITTKDFKLKWKLLKYKYPEYTFVLF